MEIKPYWELRIFWDQRSNKTEVLASCGERELQQLVSLAAGCHRYTTHPVEVRSARNQRNKLRFYFVGHEPERMTCQLGQVTWSAQADTLFNVAGLDRRQVEHFLLHYRIQCRPGFWRLITPHLVIVDPSDAPAQLKQLAYTKRSQVGNVSHWKGVTG